MAVKRCTQPVDGTIPVIALLYGDEELLGTQGAVGIYNGTQKAKHYQSGTLHVTSHRLFYLDAAKPASRSFALDLERIEKTDYYAGLFKSSAKITLHLSGAAVVSRASAPPADVFEAWECEVCSNRNPSGLSPAAARVCALCGVPRTSIPTVVVAPVRQHEPSLSLPVSPGPSPSPSLAPIDPHACEMCTFINHKDLRDCEMCGSPLPAVLRASTKSAPSSRPGSLDLDDSDDENIEEETPDAGKSPIMKLSFRKGGDKPFYVFLKRSLQSKAWLSPGVGKQMPVAIDGKGRSGIDGLMRTVETSNETTSAGMSDALQDLETFMIKAKDMALLAADLNQRLTAVSQSSNNAPGGSAFNANAEPEEATFIRSSLSQLGLEMSGTPVTADMMKDEKKWIAELARELGRVLLGSGTGSGSGGMMKERGVIAVDEVWGGWNRARGVAMLPPSTLLQVLPVLSSYTTPPIHTRKFASGLTVLHTPPFSHKEFTARLTGELEGKTIMEVAYTEKITFGLAGEMIDAVEKDGVVCRDDSSCAILGSGNEVRWKANVWKDYIWDGQED